MSSSLRASGSGARRHDGVCRRSSARNRGRAARGTISRRIDWSRCRPRLADQRRQPLQPALLAARPRSIAERRGAQRRLARALGGSGTAPQYSGEAQIVVYDDTAYVSTGADDVFAISLATGEIVWQYDAQFDPDITSVCCGWTSRGVAVSADKVSSAGSTRGSSRSTARRASRSGTSPRSAGKKTSRSRRAPLYYDGMVITGFAGADRGTRGRLKAFDAEDGRLLWTFYTIPGPGETGHETWPQDNDSWKYGGGSIWQTPAVDPELGMVYFSTGNAGPDYNGAVRAGDNLFTVSIVAIERSDRQISLALPAGASRPLGLRLAESRRADGSERRRPRAQGDRRGRQDRLGVHPRPRDRQADRRHRREARAAGTAAGDGGDAAVPARRRRSFRMASRSRPRA